MTDVTNADRVSWAQATLDAFTDRTGVDDERDAVNDLIADLGHYCDAHDLDFLSLVERGIGHWRAETFDPGDCNRIDVMPSIIISVGEVDP